MNIKKNILKITKSKNFAMYVLLFSIAVFFLYTFRELITEAAKGQSCGNNVLEVGETCDTCPHDMCVTGHVCPDTYCIVNEGVSIG